MFLCSKSVFNVCMYCAMCKCANVQCISANDPCTVFVSAENQSMNYSSAENQLHWNPFSYIGIHEHTLKLYWNQFINAASCIVLNHCWKCVLQTQQIYQKQQTNQLIHTKQNIHSRQNTIPAKKFRGKDKNLIHSFNMLMLQIKA